MGQFFLTPPKELDEAAAIRRRQSGRQFVRGIALTGPKG
jgi:hypothetical protein